MNSKPVRRVGEDSKSKSSKEAPPPDEFQRYYHAQETDPDQSKHSHSQTYTSTSETNHKNTPSPMQAMGAMPPPQQTYGSSPSPQSSYEGNSPATVQPTTSTSTSQDYYSQNYAAEPQYYADQAAPIPSSSEFWLNQSDLSVPAYSSQTQEPTPLSRTEGTVEKEKEKDLTKKISTDEMKKPPLEKKPTKPFNEEEKGLVKKPDKEKPSEKIAAKEVPKTALETVDKTLPAPPKKETKETPKTTVEKQTATEKPVQPVQGQKVETGTNSEREAPKESKEKKTEKVEEKGKPVQGQLIQISPDIQQLAYTAIQKTQSYVSQEVRSLYHNMVGAIMQTTTKGVVKTEVILNQPNSKSSQFFGSKISLTRYSTSPNSFNITISTPNPKALVQFNKGLDGLKTAFAQGDFDFKVGRLEAQYMSDKKEKFLFQRKEEAGGKDMGSGNKQ